MPNQNGSPAAAEFARLVEIVAALRSPDGCPWDREQTLASLVQYVLEEAYEVVDAIERGDMTGLQEEVGDHIFEGVLLAQVADEAGSFSVADALNVVSSKLLRRHPHVFQPDGRTHDAQSRERAPSAEAALARWDAQKAIDRAAAGHSSSPLATVPRSLPALLRAYKLGKRAAGFGFDWTNAADVAEKVREELGELDEVTREANINVERVEEEMGDLLLAIASLARKLGIEPEAALRKANDKFTARFLAMEERVLGSGKQLTDLTLDELEAEWQLVKRLPGLA